MKRIFHTILFAALPMLAAAQVDKSVEVSKEYVPAVAAAAKLPVAPDMTDTVRLRPDIDYSITPLSISTNLASKPIRPATVTYWEFNRPEPFYLKVGAGWPLNSAADFYASTQNPGTGYLLGYINHEGRYAGVRNDFGLADDALRMINRAGIAAGKYFGRHTLEGEFGYENRLYRRYGQYTMDPMPASFGPKAQYGEFDVKVRVGDDFTDLSRWNFNLGLRGALFLDHSDGGRTAGGARQTHLGVDGALARRFGSHMFRLDVMYEHGAGAKSLSDYYEDIFSGGLRYGLRGGRLRLELGADYYYDKIVGRDGRHYVVPALLVHLDLGTEAFMPYLEADGSLRDNSLRTLTRLNPYLAGPQWGDKSTVSYDARLGASGSLAGSKLVYRLFASAGIRENRLFWYGVRHDTGLTTALDVFSFAQGRQRVASLNGELEYKPAGRFHLMLGLHGYLYDDDTVYACGLPAFEGRFAARYNGRKVSFGVTADVQSVRHWTVFVYPASASGIAPAPPRMESFAAPFSVDVGADIDWRITQGFSLFAEAHNLADMKLYRYAYYPEYGINFTAGVKFVF